MKQNLFNLFIGNGADPQKVFLEAPGIATLTYGDILEQSAKFAQALIKLGVSPGDRVAAQLEKIPAAISLYLACLRTGVVYLPLNPGYTQSEINYFIRDAEPVIAICHPDKSGNFSGLTVNSRKLRVETLSDGNSGSFAKMAEGLSGYDGVIPRDDTDTAALLYTSGTTGRPKGAMITHGNLGSNVEALVRCWHISSNDVLLHGLPIFHTHGLFVAINTSLIAGCSIIFLPKFDLDEIIKHLPSSTVMMGVPTFYARLLSRLDFTKELVSHMRLFVSGSAPLPSKTYMEFERRTGHAILERYGMTETNMIASNPYIGERRCGTVGFPLPNIEIRIAHPETGKPIEQGNVGVIEVRGPNVFKGYWRKLEQTAHAFRPDGFFITGDMGMLDGDGYLKIVGRNSDVIITGGFNVYPAEIEEVINSIDKVMECAVFGVPHPDLGEAVIAAVTTWEVYNDSETTLLENDIYGQLRDHLVSYKIPRKILLLDNIPLNSMGKIEKTVLRRRYDHTFMLGLDELSSDGNT